MAGKKKICFLQVAHYPNDDRVFFHQTELLRRNNFDVSIISTRYKCLDLESDFCFDDSGMAKSAVSKEISQILIKIKPDIIICDNPLAVYFASKYKRKFQKNVKIIIDVTEWYPSKKNLVNLNTFKRFIKKNALKMLNFYSGFVVDGFVFGEYHKAKMFKKRFKRKAFVDLPYYPDLKYIKQANTKSDFANWNFLYAGSLTKEKGFENVIKAVNACALNNSNCNFVLNVISSNIPSKEQSDYISQMPGNVEVIFKNTLPFVDFCKEIANYDLFFDLRETDNENNKCLPIKLFYYMACGRPMIFSNLDAIRLQVPEIDEFGALTNPEDYENISKIVSGYIADNDKYNKHSATALEYSRKKYNWDLIADGFVKFITNELD